MFKIRRDRKGRLTIKEIFGRPLVYLDNWALNDISSNEKHRKQFINAICKRGGTLRVSVQNIDELNKQGDQEQLKVILEMIDSIDSGFININTEEVIEKENEIIKNPFVKHKDPSRDTFLIEARLESLGLRNLPLKPNVSGIISIATTGTPVRKYKDIAFANHMKRKLNAAREKQEVIKEASGSFLKLKQKGKKYDAATRELNSMAYDFIIKDTKMKMSMSSEWYDLNHVIVPVAYCDMVLIDRKWKEFVKQTGFEFPDIAMVFDKRSIDEFFIQLETNPFNELNINWRNKIKC